MPIKEVKGNIFNSQCQSIVNAVNCVGVMGKGIALVYKLRYPKMYLEYKEHCKNKLITTGSLWLYNKQKNAPWVLNFPTKNHWKYPSKIEWIAQGLQKFVATYEEKGITSIAFPLLGTHNGGLDTKDVKTLMKKYLSQCNIDIEIYEYDPSVKDHLFGQFKKRWLESNTASLKKETGLQAQYITKVTEILEAGEVHSLIDFVNYRGIGTKTLQKVFAYA